MRRDDERLADILEAAEKIAVRWLYFAGTGQRRVSAARRPAASQGTMAPWILDCGTGYTW